MYEYQVDSATSLRIKQFFKHLNKFQILDLKHIFQLERQSVMLNFFQIFIFVCTNFGFQISSLRRASDRINYETETVQFLGFDECMRAVSETFQQVVTTDKLCIVGTSMSSGILEEYLIKKWLSRWRVGFILK